MSLITRNESKIFAKGVIGNVRKAQEDCHGYKLGTPNGDLFVVCDGMGGHVGGATASRIAVESIISYIDQEQYATPVDALNGALQFANMQILGHADAHPELKGMGTTACIVLVREDDVWIAHVGDSRIYLYLGQERQLHRITKDHSFVQTLVDAGEITDDEAEHHPNKNRILKALGIKPELQPTFNHENRPIHPKNGDVFLICSDGMSGMIPDSTIESVLAEALSLQQKGERLIEKAMMGETVQPGGQDNCTVELIEIDNSPWPQSEFHSFNPPRPQPSKPQQPAESAPKPPIFPETPASPVSPATSSAPKSNRLVKILIALVAVALVGVGVVIVLPAIQKSIRNSKLQNAEQEFEIAQSEYRLASGEVVRLTGEMEKYKGMLDDAEAKLNEFKRNKSCDSIINKQKSAVNTFRKYYNEQCDSVYYADLKRTSASQKLKEAIKNRDKYKH